MNTVALNINWFSALGAWLRKPAAQPKAAAAKSESEEKPRVRIAGLR